MDTTARLDLSVWRNDDTWEYPLRIVGLDASGVALAMQVRLGPDTPGAPLIDLDKVTNGNAEGLRVAGVTVANGVPTSDVRIRINKSTRQALPYAGEMGDSASLTYALLIGGVTRIVGAFTVLAHSYGSDNAPTSRSASFGISRAASLGTNGATLTISQDGGAALVIDGANMLGNLSAETSAYAADAKASADLAGSIRDTIIADRTRLLEGGASLGEMIAAATVSVTAINGAVAIPNGIFFSNGNGNTSLIEFRAPVDDQTRALMPAVAIIRTVAIFRISSGFASTVRAPTDTFATRVTKPDGSAPYEGTIDASASGFTADEAYLVKQTTAPWTPGTKELGSLIQFSNVGPFIGDQVITLISFGFMIDTAPATMLTADDIVRAIERQRAKDGFTRSAYVGPGLDYGTLEIASNALRPATAQTRLRLVASGVEVKKADLPDYTDLVGVDRTVSAIDYPGDVQMTKASRYVTEPVRMPGNNRLACMTIKTRNSNYCAHLESANAIKNGVSIIEDCSLTHHGNQEAVAWSTANGGPDKLDVGDLWVPAIGIGMSSGGEVIVRRSTALSRNGGGIGAHNAKGQTEPCVLRYSNCLFGGSDPAAPDIAISCFASGTSDVCEMEGIGMTNGCIEYIINALPDDPAKDGAAVNDFRLIGRALSPFIFKYRDPFARRALRITAGIGAGTYVLVSGSAADVLFGPGGASGRGARVTAGAAGLRANTVGWYNVATTTMGARLGNCSAASKQLVINASGTTVTVTFSTDMRSVSNASIISTINAALGANGTADLYAVGAEYLPTIPDQEAVALNMGGFAIQQGTLVVLTGGNASCRNAEPSDFNADGSLAEPSIYFGVALELIMPGDAGRVQWRGRVSWDQMKSAGGRPTVGQGFAIQNPAEADGVHGVIFNRGIAGGALRCIRSLVEDGQGRSIPPVLSL